MRVLLTVFSCLIVAVLAAIGFIYSGIYDVAALHPDNPLVAWALHKTADQSVAMRIGTIEVPSGLDRPEVIKAGGKLFSTQCVVCHGGPGLRPTAIAEGLNPTPANLFRVNRKPRMNEMFWFIKYGVKMTAMPGFGKALSDDEVWSIAAFLRGAPGMSPQDFADKTGLSLPATTTKPSGS